MQSLSQGPEGKSELNPATRALENLAREQSKKLSNNKNGGKNRRKKCSYDLSSMLHATSSVNDQDFDFPSIGWSSDEDDECCSRKLLETPLKPLPLHSPIKRHKPTNLHHETHQEAIPSLVRSRAFTTDLSLLSSGCSAMPPESCTKAALSNDDDEFLNNLLDQLHVDFDEHPFEKETFSTSPLLSLQQNSRDD